MRRRWMLFACVLGMLLLAMPAEAQVKAKMPGRMGGGGSMMGRSGGSILGRTNSRSLLNRQGTMLNRRVGRSVGSGSFGMGSRTPVVGTGEINRHGDGKHNGHSGYGDYGDGGRPGYGHGYGYGYGYGYGCRFGCTLGGCSHSARFWGFGSFNNGLFFPDYYAPIPVIGYQFQVPIQQVPAPPAPPPPPPPTELEIAQMALQAGAAEEAVSRLQAHLEDEPEDAEAMRLLALALFDAGRIEQSVAMLAMCYELEPSQASRPFRAGDLSGGAIGLRDRVRTAVRHANRVGTASSWLMVGVLMQAEGRDRTAARMIERAAEVGLSEPVAQEFRSALNV